MAGAMTAETPETAVPPTEAPSEAGAATATARPDVYARIRRFAPVLVVLFCAGLLVVMALLRPFTDSTADPTIHDALVGLVADPAGANAANPSAAYMIIENSGGDDTLLSATTPDAERVLLQQRKGATDTDPGTLVTVDDLPVTGYGETRLQPGGDQLLLSGLRRSVAIGDTIDLTLDFDRAGTISVQAEVQTYEAIALRLLPPRLVIPPADSGTTTSTAPPSP